MTASGPGPAARQLPLGVQLREELRLDNFVAGTDDPVLPAVEALLGHRADGGLYLHGPCGSGKTHLLQAACHAAAVTGRPVAYVPLAERDRFAPGLLAGFAGLDLVCLDDVQAVCGDTSWERAVFNLYNELEAGGGRLLVASRESPGSLVLPDLNSRLAAMLRLRLRAADDERRARILSRRAAERGFTLPPDAVRYLLAHQARDLHNLMNMLDGIDRFALAAKRRVTLALVLEFLRARSG